MTERIAIVIESLGGGGAQHVAATLANAWASKGVDVTVVTFQAPETDIFRLDPRISRVVIGGSKPSANLAAALLGNFRRIFHLRAALRSSPGAIVLAFIGSTNILVTLASIGLGRRVVISERNDPARQSLGGAWDRLRKLLYRRANLVIANSSNAVATMATFVPRERLCWLPNPLRTAPPDSNDLVPIKGPFFLTVGRLTKQKGYDVLIEAFAGVAELLPDWQLVILGDGPLRAELQQMTAARGFAERLHFMGYVDNPFPWYLAAQVLVHPLKAYPTRCSKP
jgi:GalNAc-alpha-(1->4)-GalNAc-alpha-(1->3)-diNAcBac-PP-undecaprenol alpha-1,4-N-acetyl-D-galactosaminyltransferase